MRVSIRSSWVAFNVVTVKYLAEGGLASMAAGDTGRPTVKNDRKEFHGMTGRIFEDDAPRMEANSGK